MTFNMGVHQRGRGGGVGAGKTLNKNCDCVIFPFFDCLLWCFGGPFLVFAFP
jgi:hypothetical protein